ncbi:MAG: GGDEF domain-containing phosphodiesterase [Halieaceae bacterium]
MPNPPDVQRQGFLTTLDAAVVSAAQQSSNLGLLLIDLVNLGRFNHQQGYEAGDALLATAYEQLLSISKMEDSVYRVGSHRYAFILRDLSNPAFITLAMSRVERLLDDALSDEESSLSVELKVGLAVNLLGQKDAMSMFARAESSLSHVKRGGTHSLEDFTGSDTQAMHDEPLESAFADALYNNDFELHYQPKLDLATGQLIGAEALLRWQPEGMEPLSPGQVIQLAHEAGAGFELCKWVVDHTLRQMRTWRGIIDLPLALNVQAGLVSSPDLLAMLNDALIIWGVPAEQLTVEITEDAIIEDKQSGFDNLMGVRQKGMQLAIDDFGTGYSSLSYFKHIPATELKIDRSFIARMHAELLDLELVKAIIHLAHQFGLLVVAEGIEDDAALMTLQELGCDYGQGYLFSPALPAAEFEQWAQQWQGFEAS